MNEPTRVVDQARSKAARKGAEGARARGQRLGRPPGVPEEIRRRIILDRARGRTLRAIADALNADQIPTSQAGRQWQASTVRYVLTQEHHLPAAEKGP